jgi:hypothetical protein
MIGFCYAYKDWEGQSMNHGLQMDVNEFFNVLFDKLEAELKKSPHVNICHIASPDMVLIDAWCDRRSSLIMHLEVR